VRAKAVLNPKTPEPTMRMEEGGVKEGGREEEEAEVAIWGSGTGKVYVRQ
jgi:hypothetical protein